MPMPPVIYVRASRRQVRHVVHSLPAIITGQRSEGAGLVEGLMLRTGMVALSLIKEAFITKARGGIDEAGEKWEPLSEETIMRRRQGPATKRRMQIGQRTAALTGAMKGLYNREYRRRRADLLARGLGQNRAGALARAQALNMVRGRGGQVPTRRDILGSRDVEILRDTAVMYNSLSPGLPGNIHEAKAGEVIVGTNVPYSGFHHHGTRNIPQRRLWPDPEKWPQSWWRQIGQETITGIGELLVMLLQRGQ